MHLWSEHYLLLSYAVESIMIVFGVPVGYSGVNTLTDSSTMVKRGHKGDATVLRPTLIAAVPLVLERIYKVNTTFCNDPSLG
jgi:long-chain acyl-CoA synthetase